MTATALDRTLVEMSRRSASAVVARGRIKSRSLNAALLRRLSAAPGEKDSLLADPILECASSWASADVTLDDLAGGLLHPRLVETLDRAESHRLARTIRPWTHQLAAWEAARDGSSVLVSSGTGSGKTECFMVPMLDDLWRSSEQGPLRGVRAIVVYPLNALIESQRNRLGAWTSTLRRRAKFALYNGMTPETRRAVASTLHRAEIGNRRDIRESPPAILVTNVTMLEYLLLRSQDRPILDQSQGLLRWLVLDEAHGYIGAQAAEMALLLRRVRGAFGVEPEEVQLIATSATIGGGSETTEQLSQFAADLAGVDNRQVRVVEGQRADPKLPAPHEDAPLASTDLAGLDPEELWRRLAPHPRVQRLRKQAESGISMRAATETLFGPEASHRREDTIRLLDNASIATNPLSGERLLPMRAHIFHRAQGGIWVCADPACKYRDDELAADGSDWRSGAVWLRQRHRCSCGAPVLELVACDECGTPCLKARMKRGVTDRLVAAHDQSIDEFSVDEEPEAPLDLGTEEEAALPSPAEETVFLASGKDEPEPRWLNLDSGEILDNQPGVEGHWTPVLVHDAAGERTCCAGARTARLAPQRYGPAFFIGTALPEFVRSLGARAKEPGLPLAGRRALTFTDSRQGTARLAAKLQQDAERNLTRAFLYHSVQEQTGPAGEARHEAETKLAKLRMVDADFFASEIEDIEANLRGDPKPVQWEDLKNRLSQHAELEIATEVWGERGEVGRDLADDPRKLAEMFLFRELFRRPRVQNNAETMGLARLAFPDLERAAAAMVPSAFRNAASEAAHWVGLVLAAVDFVFRDSLATRVDDHRILSFVSPRGRRGVGGICKAGLEEPPADSRPWPGPAPHNGKPSRFLRLVYKLTGGDWTRPADQDRAAAVLTQLWTLVCRHAARDAGQGKFQLDYSKAAVARLDRAWLCPVTRRFLGYSPGGRSPYDPNRELVEMQLPRLPAANPGGLTSEVRAENAHWCRQDETVQELRRQGCWTDLHDRAASYVQFVRAQEHSAQIERPVLAHYEGLFEEGRINLLNCSTTMEMGIDIPDVQVVANSNVPPSISNYRQRVGRAGRRGEPWAYGLTFCRDLPLDWIVHDDPVRFLEAELAAPSVRMDSGLLVQRHVNAALLGAFVRTLPEGLQVHTSTGAFLGALRPATEQPSRGQQHSSWFEPESLADQFLDALRGKGLSVELETLVRNTALEDSSANELAERTACQFGKLVKRWRQEYTVLRSRSELASDQAARRALTLRAGRMHGEFLLSDLARRGFTPAYGFPVDVVPFDHLTLPGRGRSGASAARANFGWNQGHPTRTLDVALREYGPGSEVVVDGLVHRSDGVLPAWGTTADMSRLEDLRHFWECATCGAFGLKRDLPDSCTHCDAAITRSKKTLRPAGFLGRRRPHTGYESLGHVPYEPPKISASGGEWTAFPSAPACRWRASHSGQLLTMGSGALGNGYALCLDCGRAQSETRDRLLPRALGKHKPLAPVGEDRLRGKFCTGGFVHPERIQREVLLVHDCRTSVFELQLPPGTSRPPALALAAGLREALVRRLGAEPREVGLTASPTKGPAKDHRISAFVFDRAAGGAGFATRLAEPDWLAHCLRRAARRLDCREDCAAGCPACILRPDLNHEEHIDRPGGLGFAEGLSACLPTPGAQW